MNKDWSTKFPAKEGFYWLYGDPYMGQMGGHYFDVNPMLPEPKLYYVEVIKISNGFVAFANGQFCPTEPFNKAQHREGYVGYWKPADLPTIPLDAQKLFRG